jgi:hypothetical protein
MFTGKILTKMAPHALTLGEHCVDLEKIKRMSNPLKNRYILKINIMFMRNGGLDSTSIGKGFHP